ncbi:MAG: hypothetical protein M3530_12020 [Thermoproteota archaeon]|nr:hypothetical protein [Thermoproteota archaeon]
MSTISVYRRHSFEGRTKPGLEVKTLSSMHDCGLIIATTCLFFGIVLVLMLIGPTMAPTSVLSMDDISSCRQKIIGFERLGYYSSAEQFRLAESYCHTR